MKLLYMNNDMVYVKNLSLFGYFFKYESIFFVKIFLNKLFLLNTKSLFAMPHKNLRDAEQTFIRDGKLLVEKHGLNCLTRTCISHLVLVFSHQIPI